MLLSINILVHAGLRFGPRLNSAPPGSFMIAIFPLMGWIFYLLGYFSSDSQSFSCQWSSEFLTDAPPHISFL